MHVYVIFKKQAQCTICKSTQFELQTINEHKICKYYVNDLSKLNSISHYKNNIFNKYGSESFIEYPNCIDSFLDSYKCYFCYEKNKLSTNNPIIFNHVNKNDNTSKICYMCTHCINEHEITDESIDDFNQYKTINSFPCIRISSINKNIQYITTLKKLFDNDSLNNA
jgi:hypothetical protein